MSKILLLVFVVSTVGFSQALVQNDTSINNLVHAPGYQVNELDAIPSYRKIGRGKIAMIIIPGLGFDGSIFDDFTQRNKKQFTMYVVTLAGFGTTEAPPMPPTATSYGEQTWSKSAARGIVKLIENEKLIRPIVVGHFVTGSQIAIRLALTSPTQIGGLIVLGGSGKMMAIVQGKVREATAADMAKGTDTYWAPKWFKHMTKQFYDNGNFAPEVYSLEPNTATVLWNQVASVPMPVSVRYACEYYAGDMLAEIDKLNCPMLVVRPSFNDSFWKNEMNKNWIQPQFIESWNIAAKKNPTIQIVDIAQSAAFVWKDNPEATYQAITKFVQDSYQVNSH